MIHHNSIEEIANRSSSENVEGENLEFQTLTQEAVNEQIRVFFAPLTHQLEELTRVVRKVSTSKHPNSYPRVKLGTISGTIMPQSDNDTRSVKQLTADLMVTTKVVFASSIKMEHQTPATAILKIFSGKEQKK